MYSVCISSTGLMGSFDTRFMIAKLFQVVEECGLHVRSFDKHVFYPDGVTATVILSESHVTMSTWPERRLIHFDFFCCCDDPTKTKQFADCVAKHFKGKHKAVYIDREMMRKIPQPK